MKKTQLLSREGFFSGQSLELEFFFMHEPMGKLNVLATLQRGKKTECVSWVKKKRGGPV